MKKTEADDEKKRRKNAQKDRPVVPLREKWSDVTFAFSPQKEKRDNFRSYDERISRGYQRSSNKAIIRYDDKQTEPVKRAPK